MCQSLERPARVRRPGTREARVDSAIATIGAKVFRRRLALSLPDPSLRAAPVPAFEEDVHLLWTGGWDSTFQLLRLLLEYRRPVIPYYVVDGARASSDIELRTMDAIRASIARRDPAAARLLRPTRAFELAGIAPDADLAATFARVARAHFIGPQYEWLARFCRQHGLQDLELCVHRDDRAHGVVAPVATACTPRGYPTWRIDARTADPDAQALFGSFSFPLLAMTKLDMADEARARGWQDLMAMTWFCHRPRDGQPCGCCNPCLYTIEEGLGWRIPRRRRAISALYRVFVRPLRPLAKAVLQHFNGRPANVPEPP